MMLAVNIYNIEINVNIFTKMIKLSNCADIMLQFKSVGTFYNTSRCIEFRYQYNFNSFSYRGVNYL